MSSVKKIDRMKLPRLVADRLATEIRQGKFTQGDRLPTERELSERFGVSRNAVREAVIELRTRGLVITRQGSGSVVSNDLNKPVREVLDGLFEDHNMAEVKLMELRRILEVHVAELAAERATKPQIRDMETLLDDFDASENDLARCAALDVAFHHKLAQAAHNEMFGMILDPLNELLMTTRRRALERSGLDMAARGHRGLLRAIRARNAADAARCMAEHMDVTLDLLHASGEDPVA